MRFQPNLRRPLWPVSRSQWPNPLQLRRVELQQFASKSLPLLIGADKKTTADSRAKGSSKTVTSGDQTSNTSMVRKTTEVIKASEMLQAANEAAAAVFSKKSNLSPRTVNKLKLVAPAAIAAAVGDSSTERRSAVRLRATDGVAEINSTLANIVLEAGQLCVGARRLRLAVQTNLPAEVLDRTFGTYQRRFPPTSSERLQNYFLNPSTPFDHLADSSLAQASPAHLFPRTPSSHVPSC